MLSFEKNKNFQSSEVLTLLSAFGHRRDMKEGIAHTSSAHTNHAHARQGHEVEEARRKDEGHHRKTITVSA